MLMSLDAPLFTVVNAIGFLFTAVNTFLIDLPSTAETLALPQ